jgi:hypothetical protein
MLTRSERRILEHAWWQRPESSAPQGQRNISPEQHSATVDVYFEVGDIGLITDNTGRQDVPRPPLRMPVDRR